MDVYKQHKNYNNELFRKWASIYDIGVSFVSYIRKDVAGIGLPQKAKVIDMACGTGLQSIAFAKRGFEVVGVDLSPDMLAKARQKQDSSCNTTFILGDATHVPYPDSYFDAACISFALHDMPEEIGLAVLVEMKRIVKPGGKIIIVDYNTNRTAFAGFRKTVVNLWESRYYLNFTKTGVQNYLGKVGLRPESEKVYLLSFFQRVTCPVVK